MHEVIPHIASIHSEHVQLVGPTFAGYVVFKQSLSLSLSLYIYIYRERELDVYIYIYIYICNDPNLCSFGDARASHMMSDRISSNVAFALIVDRPGQKPGPKACPSVNMRLCMSFLV